jgi:hypothetical protein
VSVRLDDVTSALAGLTDRLVVYRAARIIDRGIRMPLEIKGLKANMLKVAQRIERLNAKAVAFDDLGGNLEQGLDDITAQVKAHGEDMAFAATVLGNGSGESEKPNDTAKGTDGQPTVFRHATSVSGSAKLTAAAATSIEWDSCNGSQRKN